MILERILVVLPADETEWRVDHPVLRRAVELGRHFDSTLTLLHVCYEHTLGFGAFASREAIDAGRLKLLARHSERQEVLGRALIDSSGLDVQTATLWSHDRSHSILDSATAQHADLILKQNGEYGYLLGLFPTTDWDLLREARIPVWFVQPAAEHQPADGIVAAVDQMFFEDDDTDQEFALDDDCFDTAKQLSDRFQCPLFAVHAYLVPNLLDGYETTLSMPPAGAAMTSARTAGAAEALRSRISRQHRDVVLDFLDHHGIPLDDVIVREGHVDQVLTASAEAVRAGLIVMGSSNRPWWDRLLGRVHAEPTLAKATCDVLFVRPC